MLGCSLRVLALIQFLLLAEFIPGEQLHDKNIDGWYRVDRSVLCMLGKGECLVDDFCLKRGIPCHHLGTGLLDELESLSVRLGWILNVHLDCAV